MTPFLFALFTAGCVAVCQVLANGAEAQARLRKARRIKRRVLELNRGELPWTWWKR